MNVPLIRANKIFLPLNPEDKIEILPPGGSIGNQHYTIFCDCGRIYKWLTTDRFCCPHCGIAVEITQCFENQRKRRKETLK